MLGDEQSEAVLVDVGHLAAHQQHGGRRREPNFHRLLDDELDERKAADAAPHLPQELGNGSRNLSARALWRLAMHAALAQHRQMVPPLLRQFRAADEPPETLLRWGDQGPLFGRLSDPELRRVLGFLDPMELLLATETCRRWFFLGSHPKLWREHHAWARRVDPMLVELRQATAAAMEQGRRRPRLAMGIRMHGRRHPRHMEPNQMQRRVHFWAVGRGPEQHEPPPPLPEVHEDEEKDLDAAGQGEPPVLAIEDWHVLDRELEWERRRLQLELRVLRGLWGPEHPQVAGISRSRVLLQRLLHREEDRFQVEAVAIARGQKQVVQPPFSARAFQHRLEQTDDRQLEQLYNDYLEHRFFERNKRPVVAAVGQVHCTYLPQAQVIEELEFRLRHEPAGNCSQAFQSVVLRSCFVLLCLLPLGAGA